MRCRKIFIPMLLTILSWQVYSLNIKPVTGSVNGVVIPIQFKDVKETISLSEISDGFNKVDDNPNGSVRNYFYTISNNKLEITSKIAPIYTARENKSYYNRSNFNSLIGEAISWLDTNGFDFSIYSKDDNGELKAVYVLYAGEMISLDLRANHSSSFGPFLVDGVKINHLVLMPTGTYFDVGTACHETGHMVCNFPDLYDYQDDSHGFGDFDGYPNAALRYICSWDEVIDITNSSPGETFTLATNGFKSYKYSNPNNPYEFYIIEAKKKDALNNIPDEGLMILHVDLTQRNNDANEMLPSGHYVISLVQADGMFNLENKVNSGDTNDLFHKGGVTVFNDTTLPNAHWWDGTPSGLSICNISSVGEQMSFTIGNKVTELKLKDYKLEVTINSKTRDANITFEVDPDLVSVVRNAEIQLFSKDEMTGYWRVKPRSYMGTFLNSFKISLFDQKPADYKMRLVYNKTVVDSVNITLLPFQGGILSTSPSSLTFENVPSGSSLTKKVKLINEGSEVIDVIKIGCNNSFYKINVNAPFSIEAGSYKEIEVTYISTAPDFYPPGILWATTTSSNKPDFVYSLTSLDVNLTLTPSIFRTDASISLQTRFRDDVNAILSLYRIDGESSVFIQSVEYSVVDGINEKHMPEWDYLPEGKYRVELQFSDLSRVVDTFIFEKQKNPNLFYMSVSPYPVVDQADIYFRNNDENLVGKKAKFEIIQNSSIIYSTSTLIQTGTNTETIRFNSYFNIQPGTYKVIMYVHSFPVDSSTLKKEDKNTTIAVNVSDLDFGKVKVGQSKTITITVSNTGNAPAVISGLYTSNNQFTVAKTIPVTLKPKQFTGIDLIYKPTSAGITNATLSIVNAPDENIQNLKVLLKGEGEGQSNNIFNVTMTPDSDPNGNSISPSIKIKNVGNNAVDMSDFVVQYYTYDPGITTSQLACDIYYCSIGAVSKKIEKLSQVYGTSTQKADMMLQFSFSSGTLSSGNEVELQFGLHSNDWQYKFNENDDWSRVISNGQATHIIVKRKSTGEIVSGIAF